MLHDMARVLIEVETLVAKSCAVMLKARIRATVNNGSNDSKGHVAEPLTGKEQGGRGQSPRAQRHQASAHSRLRRGGVLLWTRLLHGRSTGVSWTLFW